MSTFWNLFVIIGVVANILACVWLLLATSRRRPGEAAEGEETGHVWDGDLREYNNPLPRWWFNLFVITIVFSFVYMALFPGLGNFPGLLGWSQEKQHDERLAEVMEKRNALYAQFEGRDIRELADDPAARRMAGELYAINCAGCHGPGGQGAIGFPSLVSGAYKWGGTPEAIAATIRDGRSGVMPPLHTAIPPEVVPELVALVQNWEQPKLRGAALERARKQFQASCAACHGADATGNTALGAPDLTDDVWMWGGDAESIRTSILFGRSGEMPAFGDRLGEDDIRLLAAWVYGNSPERAE